MIQVHVSPDELEAALRRLGNPATRDEVLVWQAAVTGIAALRGEVVKVVDSE